MADARTPAARAIREAGDPGHASTPVAPTVLTVGQIADGEYLKRDGGRIVGGTPSGGSGAPTTAQYVTLTTDAGLSAERTLAVGTGLQLTDAGANSTITVAPANDLAAIEALTGTGFAGRTGSDTWQLYTAAEIVASGDMQPFRGVFENYVEWMQATSATGGTQAQTAGQIRYHPHVEDRDTATYDAIAFATASSPGAGALAKVALYSIAAGVPSALLWYSGDVDIASSAKFDVPFSGGTWTAAGATYKDGSSQLLLTRGMRVAKAWIRNTTGSPTSRHIGAAMRSLGVSTSGNWGGYTGWSETIAYGSAFPSTATPVDYTANAVYLPLRWV